MQAGIKISGPREQPASQVYVIDPIATGIPFSDRHSIDAEVLSVIAPHVLPHPEIVNVGIDKVVNRAKLGDSLVIRLASAAAACGAIGRFPTPIDDLLEAAKLMLVDNEELDENLFSTS